MGTRWDSGRSSAAYPLVCLAGKRACPPEDVGGVGGYEEVAAWVRAGGDDAHVFDNGLTGEEIREWLPDGWHPDDFDRDEVNAASPVSRHETPRRHSGNCRGPSAR